MLRALADSLGFLLEEGDLVGISPLTAQLIDGAIARRGRDPGGGIVGQTIARPPLNSYREGILNGFLGEIYVAKCTRQRSNRLPRLAPEQAVDNISGSVGYGCSCSTIGRTSTLPPNLSDGMSPAASRAWSIESHSIK
jgi:hypothetical protein